MSKKPMQNMPKNAATVIASGINDFGKFKVALGIIIAVFAVILYAQSVSFNYTLDDHWAINENRITTQGFNAIPTLLKTDYWYGSMLNNRVPEYRPASMIMFAIEWQLFPDNPHVSHLLNVLIYALTCWLLFILLCKIFEKKFSNYGVMFPFVCTLLYTLHPIHTEVVDSIKARDDLMCFLFGILAIMQMIKAIEKNSISRMIVAGLCYFIALFSKESAITFMVIIPLVLYVFTESTIRKIRIATGILALFTCVFLAIRYMVLASAPIDDFSSPLVNSLITAPDFMSQKATAFYVLLRYIELLIIPHPLSYNYTFAQIPNQTFKDIQALLGIIIYSIAVCVTIIKFHKKNVIAFSILLYLITIAPVSNILMLIGSPMAERFLYIPSLGFCIIITFIIFKFIKIKTGNNLLQMILWNPILFTILFIIAGLYSIKTFSRSQNWKDDYTLFSHDVYVSDKSASAHGILAITILHEIYPKENNEAVKQNLLDTAISELNKSITIYPQYNLMYNALGKAYYAKKDYINSLIIYKYMVSNNIDLSEEDFKLFASDFCNKGINFKQEGKYDLAIDEFDSAIKYDPQNEYNYIAKGISLGHLGKDSLSNQMFLKVVSINPKSIMALKNIGVNYESNNRHSIALEYFNKALAIDSMDVECLKYIGQTYQNMGDINKAKEYYEKANKIRGGKQN